MPPANIRLWERLAIVVTPDCGVDKLPDTIVVAPIFPISVLEPTDLAGLQQGTLVAGFHLPADHEMVFEDGTDASWPESYADLNAITAVAPELLMENRMIALSENQIDRLHEAWVRFGALGELSSTGSILAAKGKRIVEIVVVQATKKRYTVELVFEDGDSLVLYREPRGKPDARQSIRVDREGSFSPSTVQGLVGQNLVLLFENGGNREWNVECAPLNIQSTKLKAGQTTPMLITCPLEPMEADIVNSNKRTNKLLVRVVA